MFIICGLNYFWHNFWFLNSLVQHVNHSAKPRGRETVCPFDCQTRRGPTPWNRHQCPLLLLHYYLSVCAGTFVWSQQTKIILRKEQLTACSVIGCQKDAYWLRFTGSTAQPMSCKICWVIKPLLPDVSYLWLVGCLIVADDATLVRFLDLI